MVRAFVENDIIFGQLKLLAGVEASPIFRGWSGHHEAQDQGGDRAFCFVFTADADS